MARTRSFNHGKVLNVLKRLFWENGYDGTSYNQIMTMTGLGKGSLYAGFGDKQAMFAQALNHYIDNEVMTAVKTITDPIESLHHHDQTNLIMSRTKDFLDIAIQPVRDSDDRNGCMLCNAAVEVAPKDSKIAGIVQAGINNMTNALYQLLSTDISGSANDPAINGRAQYWVAVYFGLRVMAKSGVSHHQLIVMRDAALFTNTQHNL